jgi:hypothetical protein
LAREDSMEVDKNWTQWALVDSSREKVLALLREKNFQVASCFPLSLQKRMEVDLVGQVNRD